MISMRILVWIVFFGAISSISAQEIAKIEFENSPTLHLHTMSTYMWKTRTHTHTHMYTCTNTIYNAAQCVHMRTHTYTYIHILLI